MWLTLPMCCVWCRHEWRAVFPLWTAALECPDCGEFTPVIYVTIPGLPLVVG